MCCIAYSFLPCCIGAYNRSKLAEKYNIPEGFAAGALKHCCCGPCAGVQDINLVLVKENKTWGFTSVSAGAAPAAEVMER